MKNTLITFLIFASAFLGQAQVTKPLSQYGTTNHLANGDLIGVSVRPNTASEATKGITKANFIADLGLGPTNGVNATQSSNIASAVVGSSNVVAMTQASNFTRAIIVSSNLVDAPTASNITAAATVTRMPWLDYAFYDDFRRTNVNGSTNIGAALSGQRYNFMASDGNGVGLKSSWFTNLFVANGFLTAKQDAGYPAPGDGKIFIGVNCTNGPPNFWGVTMHFERTTNYLLTPYRPTFAILLQDRPLFNPSSSTLLFSSNWIHAALFVQPNQVDMQISVGQPGAAGFISYTTLSKSYTDATQSGVGNTGANAPFMFSLWFSGHNTLVARLGNNTTSMTVPWMDACRGTNALYEFSQEGNTNWLGGTLFVHEFFAGTIPTQPEFFPTHTVNSATLINNIYTNSYADTIVGFPVGGNFIARTNYLPPAAAFTGKELSVYDIAGTNDVFILPSGSEKINSYIGVTNISTNGMITLYSDGTGWRMKSRN